MMMFLKLGGFILLIAVVVKAVPNPYSFHRENAERQAGHHAMEMSKQPGTFEGDMILTDGQSESINNLINYEKAKSAKRRKRSDDGEDEEDLPDPVIFRKALRDLRTRWPQGIVPYAFRDDMPSAFREKILEAMAHWEHHTCIRFHQTTDELQQQVGHDNYLHFIQAGGCWSYVGMVPQFSEQQVSISNGCQYLWIIAHEIGHALGFFHEQSRPDRDDYITINFDNVIDGMERNFDKYSTDDVTTENIAYDIASAMHYGPTAFTKNGHPTITVRSDSGLNQNLLGSARELAQGDIELANIIYGCNDGGGGDDSSDDGGDDSSDDGSDGSAGSDGSSDSSSGGDGGSDGYEVEMIIAHDSSDELYWGGDGSDDEQWTAELRPGKRYYAMCWKSDKIRESNSDDVILELEFDGEAVETEEGFDDATHEGDPSSSTGGRPFIYYYFTATAEDIHKIFTCTISSASGDVEVTIPTRTVQIVPTCDVLWDVPCGEECVSNFGLWCNGREECPGGTDEDDLYCERFEVCSGHYNEAGEITSPNYPDPYPEHAYCGQLLTAPRNHSVVLSFDGDFDIEESDRCRYDAVSVFDGPSTGHHLIGRFCGDRVPDAVQSSRQHMLVVFHSDDSENGDGYSASFRFEDNGGGGGNGLRTKTLKEFHGGLVGLVDIPIREDTEDWTIKLTFRVRIKHLQIKNCDAEVVDRRKKLEYFIESKRGSPTLREGDRLRFEFVAITSRKQKGAIADVEFRSRDGGGDGGE